MRTPVLFVLLLAAAAPAEEPAANRFTFDLYRQLAGREGNLFFSGYSIHTALTMTWAGARGKTAEEMAAVLRTGAKSHAEAKALAARLGKAKEFELSVANALWPQGGVPLEAPFVDLVTDYYGASLFALDYKKTEAARARINGWVAEKTREKIRDLIQPGILDASTRLVLTNAIYFKAPWQTPFHERATKPEEFHVASGKAVEVPTMRVVGDFRYVETSGMFVVELPYSGGTSMVIAVPRELTGFPFEKAVVTSEDLRAERIALHLPKWKTTTAFDAADTLQEMGMRLAFGSEADFSGITRAEPLFLSNVIHKAFVSVDEKGTEAAAATAVVMKIGAAPQPEEPRVVRVDRPFLFWIRHCATGAILFAGRIVDPR